MIKSILASIVLLFGTIGWGSELKTPDHFDLSAFEPSSEVFAASCSIEVIVNVNQGFGNQSDANRFCSVFRDFCVVRNFSNTGYRFRYFADFDFRGVLVGQGNNRNIARNNAWNGYLGFINANQFFQGRYNHSFRFFNCD